MYPAEKGGDAMKQRWIVVLVAALAFTGVFGLSSLAIAAETFRATLTGPKEVPVCSTQGFGEVEVTIPDDQSRIDFALAYALEGSVTVAHIHLGKRTEAGGVIVFFCGGGGKPDCPPSPATVTGTIVAGDIVGPAGQGIAPGEGGELVRALRDGHTYANVHSNICPGGEVRGQLR
jgi:CHRD domain